jgi:hypothetical protein
MASAAGVGLGAAATSTQLAAVVGEAGEAVELEQADALGGEQGLDLGGAEAGDDDEVGLAGEQALAGDGEARDLSGHWPATRL